MTASQKRCITFLITGTFMLFVLVNAFLKLNDRKNEYGRMRQRGPTNEKIVFSDDNDSSNKELTPEEKAKALEEQKEQEIEKLRGLVNIPIPENAEIDWDFVKALALTATILCPEDYPGYDMDEIQQAVIKTLMRNCHKEEEEFSKYLGDSYSFSKSTPSRKAMTNAMKVYLGQDDYNLPNNLVNYYIYIYDESLEEPYYGENNIAVSSPQMAAEVSLSNETNCYPYISYLMRNSSSQTVLILFVCEA